MNTVQFIISPIAGSVIGYFTNWLAIKMLFKPHTEKRILGIKIPFTPGLIPKEKDRLAKKVGATIGEHLLSEEVLVKALMDEKIVTSLENIISDAFVHLRKNEKSIEDVLVKILGENKNKSIEVLEDKLTFFILEQLSDESVQDEIISFIMNQIEKVLDRKVEDISIDNFIEIDFIKSPVFKQWIMEQIQEYRNKFSEEERPLSQIIPHELIDEMKRFLRVLIPSCMPFVMEFLQKPFVKKKVKEIILDLVKANLGKFALMFVDGDKLYIKLIEYIHQYIENSDNQEEIIDQIEMFITEMMERSISEWIYRFEFIKDDEKIEGLYDKLILYLAHEENINSLKLKIIEHINNKKDINILTVIKRFRPSILYDIEKLIRNYFVELLQKAELTKTIKTLLSRQIKRFLSISISTWMKGMQNSVETNINQIIIDFYKRLITNQSSYIVKGLDIPSIVEERIIEFDMDYAENIILSVVDRELKAITWLGAVLGFIIGFIPVILNF